MYELDDFGNKGAWNTVKKIGNNIKKNWKPDYIIVISAHWQSKGDNLIEIDCPRNNEENPLIYDFTDFLIICIKKNSILKIICLLPMRLKRIRKEWV